MKNRYIRKLVFSGPIMSVYEIIDTKTLYSFLICDDKKTVDEVEKLLNEQDEKIKELEKENQQLKIRLDKTISDCNNLFVENQQLQQSRNRNAIEALEKLKEYCENRKQPIYHFNYVLTDETSGIKGFPTLYKYIDNQIAELRGKN